MKRFASLLLVCLFAAPTLAQEKKADTIVVPFDTIRTRHMIVDVMVNGKGPYTLIFDTGAPLSIVTTKLAKEAKLSSAGGLGGIAALLGIGQQKIDLVELAGAKVDKVDVIVMDHPTVTAIAAFAGKKIDGIVGFNVFGRFHTTIDYEKKTLTLAPGGDFRPTNMIESLTKTLASRDNKPAVLAPSGMLGLTVAKKKDDTAAGVDVESVFAGSPAAKAGIKAGDRILTIDSRWTESVNDCFDAARTLRAGDQVNVEILRDGKKQTLKATIAAGF